MPAGSLGQAYGELLNQVALALIPSPEGLDQLDDDDQYLQLRGRACHDLWHLVIGFPHDTAGRGGPLWMC
jgi:ubiquinone biosynthesis protein Coq4